MYTNVDMYSTFFFFYNNSVSCKALILCLVFIIFVTNTLICNHFRLLSVLSCSLDTWLLLDSQYNIRQGLFEAQKKNVSSDGLVFNYHENIFRSDTEVFLFFFLQNKVLVFSKFNKKSNYCSYHCNKRF